MAMIKVMRRLRFGFRLYSEAPEIRVPPMTPIETILRPRFAADEYRDSFKVASQSIQWTYAELNRYTLAFALGLLESGIKPGDKVAFWTCKGFAADTVALQLACARAGIQVVSCVADEKLPAALEGAKALVFSPWAYNESNENRRVDQLIKLIPETRHTHLGGQLKSAKYPELKAIYQLSPKTIRGMTKVKTIGVYGKEAEVASRLTGVAPTAPLLVADGTVFSQIDLVDLSTKLASDVKLTKGQTLLNAIHPKFPVSFLGTLTALNVGAKAVLSAAERRVGKYASSQQPQVVLVDALTDLSGFPEVETLLIAEKSAEAVQAVAAKLKDNQGVQAKKTIGINVQTLQQF